MPPDHSDWPGQQQPQAGSFGPGPAGFAQAGIAEAPASAGPAAPDLVVRTQRSEHTLRGGTTYRIGRDPKSDIVVADSRVSWRHGTLRVEGDRWLLEDAGSTNGTFIGQQRIDKIPIASDCVVHLGNPDDGPILRCMPQAAPAATPASAPAAPPTPVERLAEPVVPFEPAPPFEPPTPAAQAAPAAPVEPAPAPVERVRPELSREIQLPQAPSPRHPGQRDGAPGVPRELLPSVDRRPTSRMPLPAKALRIGRIPDNDLVLPDLDVSRHHAELRKSPAGTYEIVDLGSHNGTYVNGHRVSSAVIGDDDIVSIGRSTFRLAGGELRQFVDDGQVTFSAQDLVVKVGGGKILLNRVSFPIPEKSLVGVIGPSGAGKSTLLGALTGMRPADTGTVLYDNRDLYRNYAELRYRIGLVPQESVLHTQLTARRALQYSAELRFPADTGAHERDARVDEVMEELGLTKHANTRADRLSGGQLKRVNVAQELLTKPSLLFLDEPTSGLDPGLDKSVMEQMRDLAHDGRTVIVVTHSVANLDTCDRLLVLVPGGKVAYYGPPDEGLTYFGLTGWAEVFQAFERYPDRDWAAEYAASQAHAQYVLGQRSKQPPRAQDQDDMPEAVPQPRGGRQQMGTLTRRYVRVIAADRGYLLFMGLLPIILGVLIRLVGSSQGLAGPPGTNENASETLLLLVVCACLSGTASSVRELVKERTIYIRERAAGLSSGAYLSSKLLVLGVIAVVQSIVLVLLGLAGRPMPPNGSLLKGFPLVEILLGIAVLALASMCLGLLVSALVSTSEKAMPFLVLLTMVQVILSGGVISLVNKAGLSQLALIAPSRWGFGAVASTANLNVITPRAPGNLTDPLWDHTAGTWLKDMGGQIVLAIIFTLLAWIWLRRLGPRRRKG
jgi:ABC transport system ATP-binding/permease protein